VAGDDGLSRPLATTLNDIKNQIRGSEEITRADHIVSMYSEFDGRVTAMDGFLTQLVVSQSTEPSRAQIFGQMKALVDDLRVPLSDVRGQEWAVTYDGDAYKGRAFASSLLVFQKSDGTLAPVPMESPTVTAFDYRLGVP